MNNLEYLHSHLSALSPFPTEIHIARAALEDDVYLSLQSAQIFADLVKSLLNQRYTPLPDSNAVSDLVYVGYLSRVDPAAKVYKLYQMTDRGAYVARFAMQIYTRHGMIRTVNDFVDAAAIREALKYA